MVKEVWGASGCGGTQTAERPLMSSITLRALTWKSSNSPVHAHPRWSPAVLRTFNTHNKCTGVCHFVRGIPVGSAAVSRTCGVSVGSQEPLDLPGQPTRAPRYPSLWLLVITLRITQG